MNALLELLAERGLAVGLAVTAVLAVAALAVAASRSPLHRERTAELGIIVAAIAFVLMLVPLPGPVGQLSRSLETETWSESLTGHQRSSLNTGAPQIYLTLSSQSIESQANNPAGAPSEGLAATTPSQPARQSLASGPTPELGSAMAEVRREPVTLSRAVAIVFAWGAAAMLTYLAFSALVLARLARRAAQLPEWLSAALPATGDTQLLLCKQSARPFCFGLGRVRIVLPAHLVQQGNTSVLRCVVQHELAHVRLGHLRWRQGIAACSTLLFAHPLYWWLARSQREAAEFLADDQAADRVGKGHYVEQLIRLVEQLRSASSRTQLSAPLLLSVLGAPHGADGHFYQRMRTLLMRPTTLRTNLTNFQLITRGLTCAVLLTSITLALGRAAHAQDPPLSEVDDTALLEASTSKHVVQPGDTLASISQEHLGTASKVEAIATLNGINNQQQLQLGQSLTIPARQKAAPTGAFARDVRGKLAPTTSQLGMRVTATAPGPKELGLFLSSIAQAGKEHRVLSEVDITPSDTQSPQLRVTFVIPGEPDLRLLPPDLRLLQACEVTSGARITSVTKLLPGRPARDDAPRMFSLNAQNIEIVELVSSLAKFGRANIVVGPEVRGSLTVAFAGIPWREALDASVQTLGYEAVDEGSIIRIVRQVVSAFPSEKGRAPSSDPQRDPIYEGF